VVGGPPAITVKVASGPEVELKYLSRDVGQPRKVHLQVTPEGMKNDMHLRKCTDICKDIDC
jgi:hypothetical protein